MNFQPYLGFDPFKLREYEFIPLPTLRRKNIVREIVKDEDGDDEDKDEGDEGDGSEVQDDEDELKRKGEGNTDDDKAEDEDKFKQKGKGKAEADDDKDEDEGDEIGGIEDEDEDEDGEADSDNDNDNDNDNDSDSDGAKDVFGTATAYRSPFLKFPVLHHHAHPFYVIHNALPKLQVHMEDLSPKHLKLLHLMELIQAIWTGRLSKTTTSRKLPKRGRSADNDDDDDDDDKDDNDNDTFKRRTRSMTTKKQGTSKLPSTSQAKASKTRRHKVAPALPGSRFSNVDASDTKAFLYDQASEITAWSAEVAASGSVFCMDDTVSWSDDEPVRPPINDWDKWHVPYSQPREYADFCSSDWPMYFNSYALWMPSLNA